MMTCSKCNQLRPYLIIVWVNDYEHERWCLNCLYYSFDDAILFPELP